MARPNKTAAIDYSVAHDLTYGMLERASCTPDKAFVLLRDADKKGLRVRITKFGKHWQFETRIKGKLFTRALGEWPAVSIAQAQAEAHRLRGLTEQGIDPRVIERQQALIQADQEALEQLAREREIAAKLPAQTAWDAYLEDSLPHWGERNYQDHLKLSQTGGIPRLNRVGVQTLAGPLAELLILPLKELTPERIQLWAKVHAANRPARLRLSLRLLKAFLNWCARQKNLSHLTDPNAITVDIQRIAGKPERKNDTLTREQLHAWFGAVRKIQNPVIAAYLQTLLITGARRSEVLGLRWTDLNTQWKGITIRDKMEGTREVPLTPFVEQLLTNLPRRNEWIFSSTQSSSKRLTEPSEPHKKACAVAGLEGLTLHGLRRSFANLTEWLDVPGAVTAQIQGHAAQGAREKNYKRRPLDLLALHHCKIEAAFLEWAGIEFDTKTYPLKLRAVS
jgi:integrase